MKLRYRSQIIAAIAFIMSFSFGVSTVYAAPQDITLSPTSVSQVIKPGATYNGSFQVIDQGQTGYNFQIYGTPYHVSGENYTPDFTPIPNAPNVISWFKFSISSSHINPGQSIKVNYTISLPKDTLPGAYFAVAFAQTNYPKVPNTITLNERVGTIFYLQAAGPVVQKGELLTWQSGIFQESPITSIIRLEDSGALNYPATIQVNVKDIFGQSKYSLHTIKQVLPQTIRRVTISWDKAPSLGIFKVSGSVNFLNHTHTLSTKWVLVMSRTVRIYLIAIVVILILILVARIIYHALPKQKKSRSKQKPLK
jgi:hypothetical protein